VIWASPASARLIPNLGAAIEQIALCFAIFIIFLLIAALVIFTLTAFYLIVGPGSILIAFMPCRFTSAMAENYFTWLIRLGVILMMFYVVLGTAQHFAVQYNTILTNLCHPRLAINPLAVLGAVPVDVKSTVCDNVIPTGVLLQILADMTILAVICVGIPFIAGSLVNHGVNMTLEHLASAKYLAAGIARPIVQGMNAAAMHIRQSMRSTSSTTLQQRMAAGAAAAARISPSMQATTPLHPPPGNNMRPPTSPGPAPRPALPPGNGSGGGGAALEYYPGRPGQKTRAEAVDITKLQKR